MEAENARMRSKYPQKRILANVLVVECRGLVLRSCLMQSLYLKAIMLIALRYRQPLVPGDREG
ncbi:hypothetical protein D3C80_2146250 [compost metagenome]